ncbi:MAG: ribosome maturation factor RimP [Clostridia bacterium]|nr:ribosome maturation factor RimP [Clostridia bacterium]
MADKKIPQIVWELAAPFAKEAGCIIDDVEFKKEGSEYVLRVIIDVEEDCAGGVSIDQCESVSRSLSDALDSSDPISVAYMLEVSSPGIDRPLKRDKDFIRFMGRDIDIGLFKAINGSKTISGKLTGYEDGIITVNIGNEEFKIEKEKTASVRLAVIW